MDTIELTILDDTIHWVEDVFTENKIDIKNTYTYKEFIIKFIGVQLGNTKRKYTEEATENWINQTYEEWQRRKKQFKK